MLELTGRVAVVTGAVGNLGAAVVRVFREHGARVVLVDRGADRLSSTFPEMVNSKDHLLVDGVDLGDLQSVQRMVELAVGRFDRVDALVNTVGGFRGGKPLHEADVADWDAMFDINLRTTVHTCRAAARQMIRQKTGRIVNVASKAALYGAAGVSAYCASKAAVVRLTESLAQELKVSGINVNCVLPGTLDTPQNRAAMPDANRAAWVSPEAVADVIAFLASDGAAAVHGAAIPVGP